MTSNNSINKKLNTNFLSKLQSDNKKKPNYHSLNQKLNSTKRSLLVSSSRERGIYI